MWEAGEQLLIITQIKTTTAQLYWNKRGQKVAVDKVPVILHGND